MACGEKLGRLTVPTFRNVEQIKSKIVSQIANVTSFFSINEMGV